MQFHSIQNIPCVLFGNVPHYNIYTLRNTTSFPRNRKPSAQKYRPAQKRSEDDPAGQYPLLLFFGEDAEKTRRLYAAHKLTLYSRAALPEGAAPGKPAIAAAGQSRQKTAGKKMGEAAVTYSSGGLPFFCIR